VIVHILTQGLPICGFSREIPCNWPIGHKWVRPEGHSGATCGGCRRMAAEAFPSSNEAPPPSTQRCSDDDDEDSWGGWMTGFI